MEWMQGFIGRRLRRASTGADDGFVAAAYFISWEEEEERTG